MVRLELILVAALDIDLDFALDLDFDLDFDLDSDSVSLAARLPTLRAALVAASLWAAPLGSLPLLFV